MNDIPKYLRRKKEKDYRNTIRLVIVIAVLSTLIFLLVDSKLSVSTVHAYDKPMTEKEACLSMKRFNTPVAGNATNQDIIERCAREGVIISKVKRYK